MEFTHYAMPMYSRDHVTYCKQMYEWHTKMHYYQERVKAYHLDQARYYQRMMEERVKTADFKTDEDVA